MTRSDQGRLGRKELDCGPLNSAEEQEASELHARIAETARGITCPPNYGPRQALKDRNRLHSQSPPHSGVGLLSVAGHAKRQATLVFHCTRRRPTFRCAKLVNYDDALS